MLRATAHIISSSKFHIMKIRFFFLLVILWACNSEQQPTKQEPFKVSAVLPASICEGKKLLIYTLNPNDCVNCLSVFSGLNDVLSKQNYKTLYVIAVDREIEKNKFKESIISVDLNDPKTNVLWGKKLFQQVNNLTKPSATVSLVNIYDCKADSIVFSKSVKEVSDVNEIINQLQ